MKTVLYIDFIFPPVQWGWRAAKVAKYLNEFGWKPICLCCDHRCDYGRGFDYSFDEKDFQGITVHEVTPQKVIRIKQIWRGLLNRCQLSMPYPDKYRDLREPLYQEACQVLNRQKVDLIYNLSPAYTAAQVAMRLKKRYHIPWVVDFRDPWSISGKRLNYFLEYTYQKHLMKPARMFYRRRIQKDEKRILQRADKVLYPSQTLHHTMQNVYPDDAHKMEVLGSGYDESTFERVSPIRLYPGKLTITWIGTILNPYLDAIKTFIQAVKHVDQTIELLFIGRGTEAISRMGFENVTCISNVSREKAHGFAFGSDFLFVLIPPSFQDWDCSKIYSYFRVGRPILAMVPREGSMAQILDEAETGWILPFEFDPLCKELKTIFGKWRNGKESVHVQNGRHFRQYEQKQLTKKLADIFDQVLKDKKTESFIPN